MDESAELSYRATFRLRDANPQDEAFLSQLYAACHEAEFAPLQLNRNQMEGLLTMQFRAQHQGYKREFPDAKDSIVLHPETGAPMGRLLVDARADALHLVDIALLPSMSGAGIGTSLLEDLKAKAAQSRIPVRLEVRPENPASRLYSRLGFQIIGGGMQVAMEWTPETAKAEMLEAAAQVSLGPVAEAWQGRVGTQYILTNVSWDQGPFVLGLAQFTAAQGPGVGSFSLIFLGPRTPLLAQATYFLAPANAGSQPGEDIPVFLVPIGPKDEVMQYEAVFSSVVDV